MTITTWVLILYLLVPLAVLVGLCFLQAWLSGREISWPGLVLPIISFAYSVILSLASWFYAFSGESGMPVAALLLFVVCNLPTAIFLVIYVHCRKNQRMKNRLDHMNIQDL